MNKFAFVHNDVDSVADMLANVSAQSRIKKADVNSTIAPYVDPVIGSSGDWAQRLAPHVGGDNAAQLSDALRYGLFGALGGGALGLGSQLLSHPKRRRPLSGMLTGALTGGLLGAGASTVSHNWENILNTMGKKTEHQVEAEKKKLYQDAADIATIKSQPTTELAEKFKVSPGQQMRAGEMSSTFGVDNAYNSFVKQMARDNLAYEIPQDFMDKMPNRDALITAAQIHLRPYGLNTQQWIDAIANLDETKPEARAALFKKILEAHENRSITDAEGGGKWVPWTEADLQKEYPKIRDIVSKYKNFYPWAHNTPENNKVIFNKMIEASNQGWMSGQPGNPVSWAMAPFMRRLQQVPTTLQRWGHGNVGGALSFMPYGHKQEGLLKEIERSMTFPFTSPNFDTPELNKLKEQGFDPVEVLHAYRFGPDAMDQLAKKLTESGLVNEATGQPWNENDLRKHLDTVAQNVKDQTGLNSWLSPDWLQNYSTGNTQADTAIGLGLADIGGTIRNAARTKWWANPYDLEALLKGGKVPEGMDQAQYNYLKWVYANHGVSGLKRLTGSGNPLLRPGLQKLNPLYGGDPEHYLKDNRSWLGKLLGYKRDQYEPKPLGDIPPTSLTSHTSDVIKNINEKALKDVGGDPEYSLDLLERNIRNSPEGLKKLPQQVLTDIQNIKNQAQLLQSTGRPQAEIDAMVKNELTNLLNKTYKIEKAPAEVGAEIGPVRLKNVLGNDLYNRLEAVGDITYGGEKRKALNVVNEIIKKHVARAGSENDLTGMGARNLKSFDPDAPDIPIDEIPPERLLPVFREKTPKVNPETLDNEALKTWAKVEKPKPPQYENYAEYIKDPNGGIDPTKLTKLTEYLHDEILKGKHGLAKEVTPEYFKLTAEEQKAAIRRSILNREKGEPIEIPGQKPKFEPYTLKNLSERGAELRTANKSRGGFLTGSFGNEGAGALSSVPRWLGWGLPLLANEVWLNPGKMTPDEMEFLLKNVKDKAK